MNRMAFTLAPRARVELVSARADTLALRLRSRLLS